MTALVNDRDVLLMAAAVRVLNDPNAGMVLMPSAPGFHVTTGGANTPTSIVFTAALFALKGTVTFGCTGGTLTSLTATTATLTFANMSAATATVTASITVNGTTYNALPCTISKTVDGSSGLNTGSFYAYKRSATVPTDNPGNVSVDFTTNSITTASLGNGWSKTIPSVNGNPLYVEVISGSASGTTASLLASGWSAPSSLAQDGGTGTNGLNVVAVRIYQRSSNSSTAPTLPSAATTFTFASGVLTGLNNGWSTTYPAIDPAKPYVWSSIATASNTAGTDSIAAAEWAAGVLTAQDGDPNGFSPVYRWDFLASAEGWTPQNTALAGWATDVVTISSSVFGASDMIFRSPLNLNFSGALYTKVRAKVKRLGGDSSTWDGTVYFDKVGNVGEGTLGSKVIPDTTVVGQFVMLEWDMSTVSGWTSNMIEHIRIDLGQHSNDVMAIDWIQIGKYGPLPSETDVNNAANASMPLSLAAVGVTMYGTKAVKTAGTTGWNAAVNSKNSYRGAAFASAVATDTASHITFGLNNNPTLDSDNGDINYGCYFNAGVFCALENGVVKATYGAYAVGDVGRVEKNGSSVRYYLGTSLVYTSVAASASDPTEDLFFDSSFYELGSSIANIQFGPLTVRPSDSDILGNMADVRWWQRGATIPWFQNYESNSIKTISSSSGGDLVVAAGGPKGGTGDVWYAKETTGDGNNGGGWENGTLLAPLDPTKTYRFIVPIMRISGTGESYWGVNSGNVASLNTSTPFGNPYFADTGGTPLPAGKWMLFVGYIFPAGSSNKTNDGAGVFDCTTGAQWRTGTNWCFLPGPSGGNVLHRAYQFYASLNAEQIFGRPVIELVDGSESPLREYFAPSALLNSSIAIGADGTLFGGGGGKVTLPGMGQNSFRVVAKGNSATGVPATDGFYINGSIYYTGNRSYSVIIIRRSDGAIVDQNWFDVYGVGATSSGRDAGTMATMLNSYGSAYIAVVYSADEPNAHRMDGGLPAAMYRCGASRAVFGSSQFKVRAAYILVGICGCGEGNGAEAYQGAIDNDPNSWCDLGFSVLNGALTGVSTSFTPRTLVDYGYTGDMNATAGAPAGTNVGSTPATTVESNAAAGATANTTLNNPPVLNGISNVSASVYKPAVTIATIYPSITGGATVARYDWSMLTVTFGDADITYTIGTTGAAPNDKLIIKGICQISGGSTTEDIVTCTVTDTKGRTSTTQFTVDVSG